MPSFTVDGTTFFSTKDAAEQLGVAPNTVRAYIKRGTLPDVPMLRVGTKKQRGFTAEWIANAELVLTAIADGTDK